MADFLMFADEGNPEQTDQTKFFCYGGTFIPTSRHSEASEAIENLRNQFGMSTSDPLKFASRDRPKGMDTKTHTELKSQVFDIAVNCQIKFCGYAILHAISRNETHETLVHYGANILLSKFNQFLGEESSTGWANFDRLNTKDPYGYLKAKFSERIKRTDNDIRLENILGYSFTCDGTSHASSIADVLLGAFRYILNEPQRDIAGKAIAKSLAPTMWYREDDKGAKQLNGRVLVLRPREVKARNYAADYQEVRDRLTSWINT
jgi:hypothetical protein